MVACTERVTWRGKSQAGKKVLVTTYTTNLATIGGMLEALCPNEMDRIEVTNLHAWARSLLQACGVKVKTTMEDDKTADAGWQDAYSVDKDSAFPLAFYQDEWTEVVQATPTKREKGPHRHRTPPALRRRYARARDELVVTGFGKPSPLLTS